MRQVDRHLARLRHDTATVEQIVGHDATITDLGRTERERLRAASLAQQQAEETSRLRPTTRDRLLEEAQHHTEEARAARTVATDLTTERSRLFHELSPESRHDVTMLSNKPDRLLNATRQELAHAEQNYPAERAQAQAEDEAVVGRFHERAHEARQAVTGHTTLRDALVDEQATREQLPPGQRELETHWRDETARRDQQHQQLLEPDQPSNGLSLDTGTGYNLGIEPSPTSNCCGPYGDINRQIVKVTAR